jgi:hypothetical protein
MVLANGKFDFSCVCCLLTSIDTNQGSFGVFEAQAQRIDLWARLAFPATLLLHVGRFLIGGTAFAPLARRNKGLIEGGKDTGISGSLFE